MELEKIFAHHVSDKDTWFPKCQGAKKMYTQFNKGKNVLKL